MARGDQRERDRAKKQKELEKRTKSQPKVSSRCSNEEKQMMLCFALSWKAVVSRNCVLGIIGRTAICVLVDAINWHCALDI